MARSSNSPAEDRHIHEMDRRVHRLGDGAVRVTMKDGTEYVGVLSGRYQFKSDTPEGALPGTKVYSASLSLITEQDIEVDIDLLDATSLDACPEKNAVMAAILCSRGAFRR